MSSRCCVPTPLIAPELRSHGNRDSERFRARTAGIDFGLTLAAKLKDEKYAKAIQLMNEYDPQPPFPKDGTPKTADADNVKMLRAMTASFNAQIEAAV